MKLSKKILIITGILYTNLVFAQLDTSLYHEDCLIVKKNNGRRSNPLFITPGKFLGKEQVFVCFYLKKSDIIHILINDSIVQKKFIDVSLDRTGDEPDFEVKLNTKNKKSILTVYFEGDYSFIRIKIDKKYSVYSVVYHAGVWENYIYVEKQKYLHIPY